MKYDFTTIIDRKGKDAMAIDAVGSTQGHVKKPTFPKEGFSSVPGMALIQSETVRPQVFTAKCSEPQAIAVKRGGRKRCSDSFERTNRNLIQG